MEKIRIYSPIQVATASFFGGPAAAVYVLQKNFRALANTVAAKQTIIWGSVSVGCVIAVLPFLSDKFPNLLIPTTYTYCALVIATRYQMSKQAIAEAERYEFQSSWNVVGISVGFLVASCVILWVWDVGLTLLGFMRAD
jgi:hypothetical protein